MARVHVPRQVIDVEGCNGYNTTAFAFTAAHELRVNGSICVGASHAAPSLPHHLHRLGCGGATGEYCAMSQLQPGGPSWQHHSAAALMGNR